MKYIDEFRDGQLARQLAKRIAAEVNPHRYYRFMEFCGGHTHAIFRYGIQDLMPPNVRFIHGPGCPVCVLPMARIDQAIAMVRQYSITLATYGDLMRVPASHRQTLFSAKAAGADIRMISSTQDALTFARQSSNRRVVLFAIGFETTAPPTAVALITAQQEHLHNFSVFCNHVLTPPALKAILTDTTDKPLSIDGILGPSHVSTIIGSAAYTFVTQEFTIPIVIAGFEPLDVMQSTLMLIRQVNDGRCALENQYRRVVTTAGNRKAQALMNMTFKMRPHFEWRGLGCLANSALQLADEYSAFDAEQRFAVTIEPSAEPPGCQCPSVLRGQLEPPACPLFGRGCNPENPLGACMVSSEGACAAYWNYGRRASASSLQLAK